jgi:hypothetical protein
MSHEATNWAVKVRGVSHACKVVLWHLADCHNPVMGCFPTQGYLADCAELSRSSVNRCLAELEEAGLIRRQQRIDPSTKRQLPTRYFLGCEKDFQAAARVPISDTAFSPEEPRIEPPALVENPVDEAGKRPGSRVPNGPGAVSDSSDTLTCKEPVTPKSPNVTFTDLLTSWPEERRGNEAAAKGAFERLSAHDRFRAVDLVPAARAAYFSLRRPVPTLVAYLRDKLFLEFEAPPPIEERWFRITPGRDEWTPWLRWARDTRGPAAVAQAMKLGFMLVEQRWPPEHFQKSPEERA